MRAKRDSLGRKGLTLANQASRSLNLCLDSGTRKRQEDKRLRRLQDNGHLKEGKIALHLRGDCHPGYEQRLLDLASSPGVRPEWIVLPPPPEEDNVNSMIDDRNNSQVCSASRWFSNSAIVSSVVASQIDD